MNKRIYPKTHYVPSTGLALLRAAIRRCPNDAHKAEGLACMRGQKTGEFLTVLFPQDHPDRIGIFRWLTEE